MTVVVIYAGVPLITILVIGLLIYAVANHLYGGMVSVSDMILNALPTVALILLGVLLIVSIIYAIKRERVLNGVACFLSWAKCIVLCLFAFSMLVEGLASPGNVILGVITAVLIFVVVALPALLDLTLTINAWLTAKEEGTLSPPLIEAAVVYAIFAVIVIIALIRG